MFTTDPAAFCTAAAALPPLTNARRTARAAFLVAPAATTLAEESAADNRYMCLTAGYDPARALAEHAALAQALAADVPVVTFPGDPAAPDGMFPNNVFGTVPGRLIIGAMRHPVRQQEAARTDIRGFFRGLLGYRNTELASEPGVTAELTGSLVIDHARGIGYCGLSERCNLAGARAMHAAFGLRLTFAFDLAPGEYHANVVLASLAGRGVILASDGFADPAVPEAIASLYPDRVLWLTAAQKRAYAANAITLAEERVWLSRRAAEALTAAQRAALADGGFTLASVPLDEIEKAGGSLRCCVAEIF